MRVDNSTGKGMSSMDKFGSKVHRVHMELEGKLLNSSRIEKHLVMLFKHDLHQKRNSFRTFAPSTTSGNFPANTVNTPYSYREWSTEQKS